MKKTLKRLLAVIISSIMVFPAFTGCGDAQTDAHGNQKTINNNLPELVYFDVKNPQQEVKRFSEGLIVGSSVPKLVLRGQESNTMPIAGFLGPDYRYTIDGKRVDLLNDTTFQMLEDCGINAIFGNPYDMVYGSEIATRTMTLADSHKINYFCYDPTIRMGYTVSGDTANDASTIGTVSDIQASINNYKQYRYFAGFMGEDEPVQASMSSIGTSWSRFNSAATNAGLNKNELALYYNHVAPASDGGRWWSGTYTNYIQQYINTGANYLLFDMYPFNDKYSTDCEDRWLRVLALFAYQSANAGIPWWGYVQAGGNLDEDGYGYRASGKYTGYGTRFVSEGDMNYQVNTMLAFGAKGIAYYPGVVPLSSVVNRSVLNDSGNPKFSTNDHSLINEYGQKTKYYYYAQQINKQIQACDDYLMDCTFQGVIQTRQKQDGPSAGDSPIIYNKPWEMNSDPSYKKGSSYGILSSLSGNNALVGCFDYGGSFAYYVMNDSLTRNNATITLNFNANHDYLIIQRGVVGTLLAKRSFGLKLTAGEGVFVLQLDNFNNQNINDNDTQNTIDF